MKKNNDECEKVLSFKEAVEERELLDRVSDLIQEAKPLFFARQRRKNALKKICAVFVFLFMTTGTFGAVGYQYGMFDTLKYGQTLCAQDYGFPVDSYGLIMVDDEF